MNLGVYPYLCPSPDALGAEPWRAVDADGNEQPLLSAVPFWDYQMDLCLRRTVRINPARVRHDAALSEGTRLMIAVEWATSTSQLCGLLCAAEVHSNVPLLLTGNLSGTDLGGVLTLRTLVAVAADVPRPEAFVAGRAGEVLIQDIHQTRLQGDAGMFPISVCDFSAAGIDPKARWHLQVPTDPHGPATGRLRLYLNSADNEIVDAAKRAAAPTPVQRRLLDHMYADVARQLADLVLLFPGWLEAMPACLEDSESFGASVATLLGIVFPEISLEALAVRRRTQSADFASSLQGGLRRLNEARG